MNIGRRFKILEFWLKGKRNNVSLIEVVKNVFEPTSNIMAKPFINKMIKNEGYWIVNLCGIEEPLYYPVEMPIYELYQVIKEGFYKNNWHYFEIPETKVAKDDIVIDCGAAEGLFSLMVAKHCARVYAIEPLPKFVESMRRTFAKFNNVKVLPCAVAEKKGIGKMSDNSFMSSLEDGEDRTISINIETIDDLFYQQNIGVSYIKADVEGSEMKMLRGARETIKANKPKIAITTYHKPGDAAAISAFLLSICPEYRIKTKGIEGGAGEPVMLHAWIN